MMVEKNTITQEELDKMNLHGVVDPTSDVCNGIILIRNELNVLESCIKYYDDRKKKTMKKKLDKILNEIIDIRKI
ncbi:MAG: hypothetical protein II258_07825 [Spirochaetales bacterium]|jgi:hypothetical protein|nr:hypothetical protein [Spirochaetales bacterium]